MRITDNMCNWWFRHWYGSANEAHEVHCVIHAM